MLIFYSKDDRECRESIKLMMNVIRANHATFYCRNYGTIPKTVYFGMHHHMVDVLPLGWQVRINHYGIKGNEKMLYFRNPHTFHEIGEFPNVD